MDIINNSIRLHEMEQEERDAKAFKLTISELRQQRRRLGQLLIGPYAGCSTGFASMMELVKEASKMISLIS